MLRIQKHRGFDLIQLLVSNMAAIFELITSLMPANHFVRECEIYLSV